MVKKEDSHVAHDVFICHASEDKESFVRTLAEALADKGLSVWYDEFSLKVGDSFRRSIDMGLSNSRHGIVVLSPHLFEKAWPQKELDGLVTLELDGQNSILPIWHNIDRKTVLKYSPTLADRLALKSSSGIENVVSGLLKAVKPKDKYRALLHDTMNKWAAHGIVPSIQELFLFSENLKVDSLSINEMAFLYGSYIIRDEHMYRWTAEGEQPFFISRDCRSE